MVHLRGASLRNGAKDAGVYRHPQDDQAIDLLKHVSCGGKTYLTPS